jgi:hypothetical protein
VQTEVFPFEPDTQQYAMEYRHRKICSRQHDIWLWYAMTAKHILDIAIPVAVLSSEGP